MPKFREIPQLTSYGHYRIDVSWDYLPTQLDSWQEYKEQPLNLDPDFQRAHVWTEQQQIDYIEFCLRGGQGSNEILFNCPGWMHSFKPQEGEESNEFVLVDGKQRIQAALQFLNDKITAFGYKFSDYKDKLNMLRPSFSFRVNDLETRAEVLQWYLEINTGGIVHKEEEINKVRKLLEEESSS